MVQRKLFSPQTLPTTNFWKGGDLMRIELGLEQGMGEQFDPIDTAIGELQGPVNPEHEAFIRKAFYKTSITGNQRDDEGNNDRFPERVMIERPSDLSLGVGSVQVRQVKP